MRTKELVCIVCPNGCNLEATLEPDGGKERVVEVTGQICEKGPTWAAQELINPMRTISSSIPVEGGHVPLVSVKTDAPIPKERIMDVMKAIKGIRVKAPVRIGDCLIKSPAGTGCNIVATRHVERTEVP